MILYLPSFERMESGAVFSPKPSIHRLRRTSLNQPRACQLIIIEEALEAMRAEHFGSALSRLQAGVVFAASGLVRAAIHGKGGVRWYQVVPTPSALIQITGRSPGTDSMNRGLRLISDACWNYWSADEPIEALVAGDVIVEREITLNNCP